MQRSYNPPCKSSAFVLFLTAIVLLSSNASIAFAAEDNEDVDQEEKIDYRPDRVLTKEERKKLQELSKTLITKSTSPNANTRSRSEVHRGWAADDLGYTHHKAALPALFAVLKDKTDSPGVRVNCICALKRINDKRVIEVLMDAALDDHYNVANHAKDALFCLLPGSYRLDPKWSKERKEQEVEKWRTWWRENRDKLERPIRESAWRPPKKEK